VVSEQTWEAAAEDKAGAAPVIMVVQWGHWKFWKREFSEQPGVVKTKFSHRIAKKIKGGRWVVPSWLKPLGGRFITC
jgi:hypothetical protein